MQGEDLAKMITVAMDQMMQEIWGIIFAINANKHYLIIMEVVIETDCLPIVGMIAKCSTPNLAMLRWIANINQINEPRSPPYIRKEQCDGKHTIKGKLQR